MPDKANVGPVDAAIRWVLAAVFFAAALIWNDIPLVALLAALVALAMAGTALTRILSPLPGARREHLQAGRGKPMTAPRRGETPNPNLARPWHRPAGA